MDGRIGWSVGVGEETRDRQRRDRQMERVRDRRSKRGKDGWMS